MATQVALAVLVQCGLSAALPAHAPAAPLMPQEAEIRRLAAQGSGVLDLMPMLSQTWETRQGQGAPKMAFPFPPMTFPQSRSSFSEAPTALLASGHPQESPAAQKKPAEAMAAGMNMAKCQIPLNLTYCSGVSWPVPYQGWTEWEVYVEDTLRYYMDYIYDDAEDDGRNSSTKITEGCRTAMKNIGCAFYFPKCDAQDNPVAPCKTLCTKWKKELSCPGSDSYSCSAANGHSASFGGQGKCTDFPGGGAAEKGAEKGKEKGGAMASKFSNFVAVNEPVPEQKAVPVPAVPAVPEKKQTDEEAEETN